MDYSKTIKKFINVEKTCLDQVCANIDDKTYDEAVKCMLACKGRIIFLGVGKSGLIGKKLAATFSSTGTPSFFVHATEACHGDLGMIQPQDIVVMISNSGETGEVINTLEPIKRIGSMIISMTSNPDSTIARASDIALTLAVVREADPLDLAPTNSSTSTLVVGDAIALTLSEIKNFKKTDFAKYHPGGTLGVKSAS